MSLLEGRRVLLVEDESLVAMLAEDMLLDLGCEVVVAMRLEQALAQVKANEFDFAVLDVNLGEARSYPVADVLFERCVPFLFATGYGLAGVETAYRSVPVMQKPYQKEQMGKLLKHLLICEHPAQKGASSREWGCTCQGEGEQAKPGEFRADRVG